MIKLIKRKNFELSLFVKTALSLVKIGTAGLEKKILKFRQNILLFRNHLHLEKGVARD